MDVEPVGLAIVVWALVVAVRSWPAASALRRAGLVVGVGVLAAALVWPLPGAGEHSSVAAHFGQHVLLWDVAPIALIAGAGQLPPGFPRRLANPAVALPFWVASLAFWNVPAVFDAAVRHEWLHGVEHLQLFVAGLAMWAPILGVVRTPAWFGVGARFAYVAAMQLAGLLLGNLLLWWASPIYAIPPALYGSLGPLADQRLGGGIVLLEGSAVAVAAFAGLFLRLVASDRPDDRP